MIPRIHCPQGLAPGAHVELPEAAANHVARVLRLGEGAPLTLFDGRGGEWSATVAHVRKNVVEARLDAFDAVEREAPLPVTLAQGLPAADKMDWIVQKGVELGVAAFRPLAARRSVIRLSGERMARRVAHWQAVAVAACEQSRRNRVPEVATIVDLPHFLAEPPAAGELRLMLDPAADRRLADLPRPGAVTLLVGPEGGFEEGELAAARLAGFQAIRLGPRVLRTETAGMAALAAIMSLWGDF